MINMNGTGEESRKRQKRNSRESKRSNAEREWKGRGVAEGVCTLKKKNTSHWISPHVFLPFLPGYQF